MAFDTGDLSARETALLALEYLRSSATWFEQAAAEKHYGAEVARLLSEIGDSTRDLAARLERRLGDRFGLDETKRPPTTRRLKRPVWLVDAEDGAPELSAEEILEAATSEQEEHYHFFLMQQEEVEDDGLRELFWELAEHARRTVVYLESERELILEFEG